MASQDNEIAFEDHWLPERRELVLGSHDAPMYLYNLRESFRISESKRNGWSWEEPHPFFVKLTKEIDVALGRTSWNHILLRRKERRRYRDIRLRSKTKKEIARRKRDEEEAVANMEREKAAQDVTKIAEEVMPNRGVFERSKLSKDKEQSAGHA